MFKIAFTVCCLLLANAHAINIGQQILSEIGVVLEESFEEAESLIGSAADSLKENLALFGIGVRNIKEPEIDEEKIENEEMKIYKEHCKKIVDIALSGGSVLDIRQGLHDMLEDLMNHEDNPTSKFVESIVSVLPNTSENFLNEVNKIKDELKLACGPAVKVVAKTIWTTVNEGAKKDKDGAKSNNEEDKNIKLLKKLLSHFHKSLNEIMKKMKSTQ